MIVEAVQAAAMIAQTVSSITDANKRRTIEANLALMSEKEKIALAQQIEKQKNKNAQTEMLVNTILTARNANADRAAKAEKTKWILIGSAGVITLGILAWYLKK